MRPSWSRAYPSLSSFRSLALAAVIVLVAAGPLLAHGDLKSAAPKAGEHLSVAPRELRLTFTEAPELAVARLELIGPDGARVSLGPLRISPDSNTVVIAAITGPLTAGTYTVNWQVAGADGHPVRGTYAFVIAPGAAGLGDPGAPMAGRLGDSTASHHDPVSTPIAAEGFDAESPAYVFIRFLMYAAMLIVIGAVAFRTVVLRRVQRLSGDAALVGPMAGRAAAVGFFASVLLLVSVLARLVAQAVAHHGSRGMTDLTLVGTLLTGTSWGRSWLLQLVAALAALVAFRFARRRQHGTGAAWIIAVAAALALAFTPAFASHAAASPRLTTLAVLSDGLHVIGAAGWLGSLLLVLLAGIPAAMSLPEERRGAAVADLINAFSPTALVFAGLVALTGLFAAWLHVGGFAPLWEEKYGRLLLAKLAILSVVALTGAYNWLRVKPTLGQVEGAARIQRSARVEVAVGVLILVVTAILVATPAPMDPM
jgi:putative copper export protein/methionine-rich copper-binding protein CopC